MFTQQKRINHLLQLVMDAACLQPIWLCTIAARILFNPWLHEHVTVERSRLWVPSLALILPLWMVLSIRFRLYRLPATAFFWAVQISALENTLILATVTAATILFSRQFGESLSRMFVPVMVPIAFVAFCLMRVLVSAILPFIHKCRQKHLRFALIADCESAQRFVQKLRDGQAEMFKGLILPEECQSTPVGHELPILGTTHQLGELINKERLNRVFVLNTSLRSGELDRCARIFDRMDVPVSCALEMSPDPIELNVSSSNGIPFIEVMPIRFTRRQEIVKRGFDLIVAAVFFIVLIPLLLMIAASIKLTSKGPVLYKAPRIGKGGRRFTFYKFRSMYLASCRKTVAVANEKRGHIFKMKNDPRVTPIGRLMRRYSLDELPQLLNILSGEMSFVGPRPLPASDLDLDGMSKEYVDWSEGRSTVPPGLTGLWQVSGRSDLSFEEMVRLDLAYIQNWSLALDLKIILDTPLLVLRGVGAY